MQLAAGVEADNLDDDCAGRCEQQNRNAGSGVKQDCKAITSILSKERPVQITSNG